MIVDQKEAIEALMKPEAYDEDAGHIELVQTHISFVFLTNNHAYKVKKAIDLGFLDFTTLEKRRFFCEKELELNRRLCGDMYLEVVPINKSSTIKMKGKGKTIEYTLKMKRISQKRMLSTLLENNKVDNNLIGKIAKIIAEFHSKAETNEKIREFGSLDIIKTNWKENFDQTEEFIESTISVGDYEAIREKVNKYIKQNGALFEKRAVEGRVRDCHGDIHSGNIFVAEKIYIFDAIEFNERFRYSDVTADIAFLAMDLDFRERTDLSDLLTRKYIECSGDEGVIKLFPFYKCYRAYVRGKVTSFKLKDENVSIKDRSTAKREATAYFKLASDYAKSL
jgi:aminoglycoside phosphotransferase family enzyme